MLTTVLDQLLNNPYDIQLKKPELIYHNDDELYMTVRFPVSYKLREEIIKDYKKIHTLKGKEFKNTICNHPFVKIGYEHDIPMLEARFVTTEQGTGIVHCAPSHGPDDFNLCLNNGIKAIETVDGDGKYTNNVKLFEGIHIFKANSVALISFFVGSYDMLSQCNCKILIIHAPLILIKVF